MYKSPGYTIHQGAPDLFPLACWVVGLLHSSVDGMVEGVCTLYMTASQCRGCCRGCTLHVRICTARRLKQQDPGNCPPQVYDSWHSASAANRNRSCDLDTHPQLMARPANRMVSSNHTTGIEVKLMRPEDVALFSHHCLAMSNSRFRPTQRTLTSQATTKGDLGCGITTLMKKILQV